MKAARECRVAGVPVVAIGRAVPAAGRVGKIKADGDA